MAHDARLNKIQKDGSPLRDHVAQAVSMGRRDPSELDGPGMPDSMRHLWGWFQELAMVRSVGMNGANPINFGDIDAWARLTDREVLPHEVRALMRIDFETRHPRDKD